MEKNKMNIFFQKAAEWGNRLMYAKLIGIDQTNLSPNRIPKKHLKNRCEMEILVRPVGSDAEPIAIGKAEMFKLNV